MNKSNASFQDLLQKFFLADKEEEREKLLEEIASGPAKTYAQWVFLLAYAKDKKIHHTAESKAVSLAPKVSDVNFLLNTYQISLRQQKIAVKRAISMADNLSDVKDICAQCGMMFEYSREVVRRAIK